MRISLDLSSSSIEFHRQFLLNTSDLICNLQKIYIVIYLHSVRHYFDCIPQVSTKTIHIVLIFPRISFKWRPHYGTIYFPIEWPLIFRSSFKDLFEIVNSNGEKLNLTPLPPKPVENEWNESSHILSELFMSNFHISAILGKLTSEQHNDTIYSETCSCFLLCGAAQPGH